MKLFAFFAFLALVMALAGLYFAETGSHHIGALLVGAALGSAYSAGTQKKES